MISKGSGLENGDVPVHVVREQIRVMNETFAEARGGAVTGFEFESRAGVEVDRTSARGIALGRSVRHDPVQNSMDYSDPCYTEFTGGQTDRMQAAWFTFRQ